MSAVSVAPPEQKIPWWLILIEGIALVILGILWLASPGMTTAVVVRLLGIYWLIAGLFRIIGIFLDHEQWGWKLLMGVLGIIAGILVLQHPLWSTLIVGATLTVTLGIFGAVIGAMGLYRASKGEGLAAGILAAITLLFGLLLLFNVAVVTQVLPWILGGLALVGGIVVIVLAFRARE